MAQPQRPVAPSAPPAGSGVAVAAAGSFRSSSCDWARRSCTSRSSGKARGEEAPRAGPLPPAGLPSGRGRTAGRGRPGTGGRRPWGRRSACPRPPRASRRPSLRARRSRTRGRGLRGPRRRRRPAPAPPSRSASGRGPRPRAGTPPRTGGRSTPPSPRALPPHRGRRGWLRRRRSPTFPTGRPRPAARVPASEEGTGGGTRKGEAALQQEVAPEPGDPEEHPRHQEGDGEVHVDRVQRPQVQVHGSLLVFRRLR